MEVEKNFIDYFSFKGKIKITSNGDGWIVSIRELWGKKMKLRVKIMAKKMMNFDQKIKTVKLNQFIFLN